MLYQSFLKGAFKRVFGYWIYKSKHLPTGVDLFVDIENHYPETKFDIVFDIGANNGHSAIVMSKRFTSPIIYSFEPDKQVFNQLVENTKNLAIKPYNFGIGHEKKIMKLYKGKHTEWNSFIRDLNNNEDYSEIPVIKIDDFIKENNIEYISFMKIDTEGFDLNVLKGSEDTLRNGKIGFIYTEAGFYENNKRNTSFWEIVKYLKQFDYMLFSIYQIAKSGSHMVNGNALFVKRH